MDPGCNGKTVSVTLTGAANASLGAGSIAYSSAAANTTAVVSSLPVVNAASVTGVSVAING
jgi:hypothetical protein